MNCALSIHSLLVTWQRLLVKWPQHSLARWEGTQFARQNKKGKTTLNSNPNSSKNKKACTATQSFKNHK